MKTIVNEIKALNFLEIISMSKDSSFFSSNDFRASMLVSVIETLCGFINVDEGFNFFPEIFTLASKLLNQLAGQDHTPVALRDKSKDVSGFIEKKIKWYNQTRQPLQMRKRDPVPIKFSVPKFEDNYIKGRNYDPDCERAETKKTRKRIKEEAKGAIRELRKHNYFLAKAKAKDKAYLKKKGREVREGMSFPSRKRARLKIRAIGQRKEKEEIKETFSEVTDLKIRNVSSSKRVVLTLEYTICILYLGVDILFISGYQVA